MSEELVEVDDRSYEKRAREIARIEAMDRGDLLALWRSNVGVPPKNLSIQLMRMALVYEYQLAEDLELHKRGQKALHDLIRSVSPRPEIDARLKPGAKLVREWQGRSYTVNVTEDGFELDGKVFASLSAVAKHITGSHWSGPRFFGLVSAGSSRIKAEF